MATPENFGKLFGIYFLVLAVLAGLLVLFVYLCKLQRRKQIDAAVDRIEHADAMGATDENGNLIVDPDEGVIGAPLSDTILYKATPRDKVFYIAAIVMASVSTIFTFIWGIL